MDMLDAKREDVKQRITDAVEVAKDTAKSNPVGILRQRFQMLYSMRQPFIDEAKDMAELVVPGMYEGCVTDPVPSTGVLFGLEKFEPSNQSLISKGVLLLSWTMANVILPPDGDYFSRSVEESIVSQLKQMEGLRQLASQQMGQGGDPPDFVPISEQVNGELLRDDIIVKRHTASSNHQEVLARTIFHSLISGLGVFGHLTMQEAKTYTIQNSVVVFDSSHDAVEVVVVDRMPLVSLSDAVQRKLVGKIDGLEMLRPTEQFVTVYTQQVRTSPTSLKVNTEIEGVPIDELSFEVPATSPVLIPLPFMFMNEIDPYPIGWLTFNKGDCNSYENLSLSIEGMIAAAAKCLLGLPPGSRLTTEELREAVGLAVVPTSDAKARLEFIAAPIAQNLQQCLAWHDKKERQLMMIFGMDFAVQRPGERVTAEEIQRMSDGLQKLFGATYKQLERTFQQRHARRQFQLATEAQLIRPIDEASYTLSLTAGLQAMEAQNEVSKMDQLLARDAQLAQMDAAGGSSFSRDATMQWYAQKMKLDTTDKLLTSEQQAEQLGVGQLIKMVRQMGPQAPGMVAQMIAQAAQQGGVPAMQSNGAPPQMGQQS